MNMVPMNAGRASISTTCSNRCGDNHIKLALVVSALLMTSVIDIVVALSGRTLGCTLSHMENYGFASAISMAFTVMMLFLSTTIITVVCFALRFYWSYSHPYS